jgi:hypothetical protein
VTLRQVAGRAAARSLLAVCVLASSGCGSAGSAHAEPSIGAAPPGEVAATLAPTIPPDNEFLGSSRIDSSKFTDEAGFVSFTTPTHNVACTVATATVPSVTCQPSSVGYSVKEHGSCPSGSGTWGDTVALTKSATWSCTADKIATTSVLGYGARIDTQDFSCVSRPDGVTCHDAATDHGFRIAPGFYTLF